MKKPTLLSEFKHNLDKFSNPYLGCIYINLFDLLGDERLEDILTQAQDDYVNHKDEGWFAMFHKRIRQCDIFASVKGYRVIDKLTDEQKTRRDELLKIREREWNLFVKQNPDEDYAKYKEFNKTPERESTFKELQKLNDIMRTKEDVSIGGILDSILYNLIHAEDELFDAMERTFKICI